MSKFNKAAAFKFIPAIVPERSNAIFALSATGTTPGVGQFCILATDADTLQSAWERIMGEHPLDMDGVQEVAIFQKKKVHMDFA